jgi:hypothetical protein
MLLTAGAFRLSYLLLNQLESRMHVIFHMMHLDVVFFALGLELGNLTLQMSVLLSQTSDVSMTLRHNLNPMDGLFLGHGYSISW